MAKQATAESELESIVGRRNIARGRALEAYAVDGLVPATAVKPASYDEVAEILRFAATERLAVIPRGGGTAMHVGNVPSAYDIALDLTRLSTIVEHEAADLTVTCQAGINLGALATALAPDRQVVPFDPALPTSATAGGVVASGTSGATRLAFGSPRDFTIGLRVVTAAGAVTRAGGKVVKNVAGYDLCKLYTGSRGTLAVIVETTFKVLPVPATAGAMSVGFEEPADACAFASSIYRHGMAVRGMTLRSIETAALTPASCVLTLDIAGTTGAVGRTVSEIERLASSDEGVTLLQADPPQGKAASPLSAFRIAVRPTDLPSLIAGIGTLHDDAAWTAFPVTGILNVEIPVASLELVEQARYVTERLGGSLTVEVCPNDLKQEIDVYGPEPPSISLMRNVKRQFDPTGVLSPGRFVGRI